MSEAERRKARLKGRIRNALLGGIAGAGLGSVLAKPDVGYKWARGGFIGGAAAGAAVNPRKRAELSAVELAAGGCARDERGRKIVQLVARMRQEKQKPKEGFWARHGARVAGAAAAIGAVGALATLKDRGMRFRHEPKSTITDELLGRKVAPSVTPTPPPPRRKSWSVSARGSRPGRKVDLHQRAMGAIVTLRAERRAIELNVADPEQSNRFTPSLSAGTIYRKGRRALVGVRRSGNMAQDAADVIAGRRRQPGKKREWEKSWFKNAVAGAALGAAMWGVPRAYAYRVTQKTGTGPGTTWPDVIAHARRGGLKKLFESPAGKRVCLAVARMRLVELDTQAAYAGWDLRDARGKSARVYAPGSRRRDRREKTKWERVDTIRAMRNAAMGVAAAGLAGSGVLGWQNRKLRMALKPKAPAAASNLVPFKKAR
jgi:hypothetical protein